MALIPSQIDAVAALLRAAAPGGNPVPALRSAFPGLMVTRCDADDMRGETPVQRLPAFDLFLVDASQHCWRMVTDPEEATGMVVADRAS